MPSQKGTDRKWSNDALQAGTKENLEQVWGSAMSQYSERKNVLDYKVPIFTLTFDFVRLHEYIGSRMLKLKRGAELVSTSCYASRDLFVSQILAKIKPEIKGFDKIWLSLVAHHLFPQAVGSSSLWLSAAWGVRLTGSPQESCWLGLRSTWMVMMMIRAARRVEMPGSSRS